MKHIKVYFLILFFSSCVFQHNEKVESDQIFKAVLTSDMKFLSENLTKTDFIFSNQSSDENLNLLEYAIFWFKNYELEFLLKKKNLLQFEYTKEEEARILSTSILSGNLEALKILIQNDFRFTSEERIFKDLCSFIEKLLLARSISYNDSKHLKLIPEKAEQEFLTYIIENKLFPINFVDGTGKTFLHNLFSHIDIVKILFDFQIKKNITDDSGKNAMDYLIEDMFSFDDSIFLSGLNVFELMVNNGCELASGEDPWCNVLEKLDKGFEVDSKIYEKIFYKCSS